MQWEAPADYRMAADDATMAAVIKIQCVYRSRRTKRRMGEILAGRGGARGAAKLKVEAAIAEHDAAAAASFAAQAETGGVWVEAFDPNSGKMYYFHTGTSENSWEKPDVYVMAADNVMVRVIVFLFLFTEEESFVFRKICNTNTRLPRITKIYLCSFNILVNVFASSSSFLLDGRCD